MPRSGSKDQICSYFLLTRTRTLRRLYIHALEYSYTRIITQTVGLDLSYNVLARRYNNSSCSLQILTHTLKYYQLKPANLCTEHILKSSETKEAKAAGMERSRTHYELLHSRYVQRTILVQRLLTLA